MLRRSRDAHLANQASKTNAVDLHTAAKITSTSNRFLEVLSIENPKLQIVFGSSIRWIESSRTPRSVSAAYRPKYSNPRPARATMCSHLQNVATTVKIAKITAKDTLRRESFVV